MIYNVNKYTPSKVLKTIQDLLNVKYVVIVYNHYNNKFGFMTNVKTDVKTSELIHKLLRCSKLGDVIINDLIQCPKLDIEKLTLMKNNGVDVVKMLCNM